MPDNEHTTKFKVDVSELKKNMQDARREMALSNSEFKAAASSLDDWSTSADGISAKIKQLNSNAKSQKTILEALEKQYEAVAEELGRDSKEAQNLEIKINNQKAVVNTTEKEIRKYKKSLDDLESSSKAASGGIDDLSDSAGDSKDSLSIMDVAVGNLAAGGISALVNKGLEAVKTLSELSEETREYREDMAKLEAAFKTSNHSAEAAEEIYDSLYAILGESDRSVEAANHLAELTDNTEDLTKWQTIAAGVTAKFGDSLPLEGLTEAANETAKVGKVTGPLADAINWITLDTNQWSAAMGNNNEAQKAFNESLKKGEPIEDAYSAALAKMNTQQERATSITAVLTAGYSKAADEYNALTADAQKARLETNEMEKAQARLGAALEPVSSGLKKVKTALINFGADVVEKISSVGDEIDVVADILSDSEKKIIDSALEASEKFDDMTRASEKNATAIHSNYNYVENLVDELYELVDANGEVKGSEKARADYILGELNEALGTEYKWADLLKLKNGELKDSIYDLIKAKRVEALSNEYTDDYNEAVTNIESEVAALAEARKAIDEAQEQFDYYQGKISHNGLRDATDTENMHKWEEKLNKAKEDYEKLIDTIDKYNAIIGTVEGVEEAQLTGDIDKALELWNDYSVAAKANSEGVSQAYKTEEEAAWASYERQRNSHKALISSYEERKNNLSDIQKEQYEKLISDGADSEEREFQKWLAIADASTKGYRLGLTRGITSIVNEDGTTSEVLAWFDKTGRLIPDNIASGIVENSSMVSDGAAEAIDGGIKSGETKAAESVKVGYDFSAGVAVGIKAGQYLVDNAAADVINSATITAKRKENSNSPAKVPEEEVGMPWSQGVAIGIEKEGHKVNKAAEKVVGGSIKHTKNKHFEESAEEIGDYLTKGLIIGAEKDSKKFNKTMASIMEGGIKAQEKAAEINSPSKREEELGEMLMLGLSGGIEDNAHYVLKSLDELNKDTLASEAFYASEKARIDAERSEAEYNEKLKNAKTAEEIAKIKNERIEKENKEAQDKYLKSLEDTAKKERKIADETAKTIENTIKDVEKSLDDFVGDAFDKIEEFEKLRDKIMESFAKEGDNGLTYQTVSIVGDGLDLTFNKLADISPDTDILKAYNDSLDSLVERFGSIPDIVSGYLSDMDLGDAKKYVDAILNSSDEEYKKYTDSLEERSRIAEEIAHKTTANQANDLKNDILIDVAALPDEIAKIGEESGVTFADGFLANLNNLIDGIGQSLREEFVDIGIGDSGNVFKSLRNIGKLSGDIQNTFENVNNNIGGTKVYNYTQNIYSPKQPSRLDSHRKFYNFAEFRGGGN